jgi:hypothetical protein
MQLKRLTLDLMYRLGILLTLILVSGCGSDSESADKAASDPSAAITFELDFSHPSNHATEALVDHALGEPDICNDFQIDTIGVQIYRTVDDTEVASAQSDCTDHTLTVTNVPAAESLYVLCYGYIGLDTIWQGQVDNIVAEAGQTTNIGIIDMYYIGDDTAGPAIVSTFPEKDAANVDINASISVTFNEALAPSTIPDQAIMVFTNDTPLSGTVDYNPDAFTIRFVPSGENGLDVETTYTATLQSQGDDNVTITDIVGHPFDGALSWQFTTRSADDTAAPQVIATSPTNGAADVDQLSTISAVFSEPMDPDSFTSSVFQLSSDHGTVSAQIAYNDQTRTLSLTPDSALDAATLYTAVISTEAEDLAQNALLEPYVWQFLTGGSDQSYTIATEVIPENGSGGSISPTIATVSHGDDLTIDIQARPYHHLSKLIVDDQPVTPVASYLFENVTANHTVLAVFEINAVAISDDSAIREGSAQINADGHVVWEGYDESNSNAEIYYYNGSTVENISNNIDVHDSFPQINAHGDVVWMGDRESSRNDIFYFDKQKEAVTNISNKPPIDGLHIPNDPPKINAHGDVVWNYYGESSYDIFFYGLLINQAVIISGNLNGNDMAPQINDNKDVVWKGWDGTDYRIYYGDMKGGTIISGNWDVAGDPQINADGHVVWQGYGKLNHDILLYDNGAERITNISDTSDFKDVSDSSPQINANGNVVWEGYDGTDIDIYYYDAATKVVTNISKNPDGNDSSPQINADGNVVWAGFDGSDIDIYYYDKETDVVTNISRNPDGTDGSPQINAEGAVVWHGSVDSNTEIYLSVP